MDPLPCKDVYILKDFSKYHGLDFLKTAYTAILGRLPDPEGEQSYLARLKHGEYTKNEITCQAKIFPGRKKKKSPCQRSFFFPLPLKDPLRFLFWDGD